MAYVIYRLVTRPTAGPGWARSESRYLPLRAAGWHIPAAPGAETCAFAKDICDMP